MRIADDERARHPHGTNDLRDHYDKGYPIRNSQVSFVPAHKSTKSNLMMAHSWFVVLTSSPPPGHAAGPTFTWWSRCHFSDVSLEVGRRWHFTAWTSFPVQ